MEWQRGTSRHGLDRGKSRSAPPIRRPLRLEQLEDRRVLAAAVEIIELNHAGFGVTPTEITAVAGALYFAGTDGESGTELWRSDGTIVGTRRLKDIRPGFASSRPHSLIDVDGRLFFVANDGSGDELWTSDGTEEGTYRVKEINPTFHYDYWNPGNSIYYGAQIEEMTVVDGVLYFTADNGGSNYELWKSDGTEAGTTMVRDLAPPGQPSRPRHLINMNGTLYFQAYNGLNGEDLWRSDGTFEGTWRVKSLSAFNLAASQRKQTVVVGETLYFFNDSALWRSDGTEAGTDLVAAVDGIPYEIVASDEVMYFAVRDSTNGSSLWKSDGTPAGTAKVVTTVVDPAQLTMVGDALYYTRGLELWRTDGTTAGTWRVADSTLPGEFTSGQFQSLTAFGDALAFTFGDAVAHTLWITDGTADGTRRILPPGGALTVARSSLVVVGEQLHFAGDDGFTGLELWTSDGTSAGTRRVADALHGSLGSSPENFVELNGRIIFTANHNQVWSTDGTVAGTRLIGEFGNSTYWLRAFTVVGDIAYFTAYSIASSVPRAPLELWCTDGTAEGTRLVRSNVPPSHDNYGSLNLGNLIGMNGLLYFTEFSSGDDGLSLWKTDGTPTGTVRVSAPWIARTMNNFVVMDDVLYFIGDDQYEGVELWRSDGTTAGTYRVTNINPSGDALVPSHPVFLDWAGYLTVVGDHLYFPANDGASGVELWRTDGTAAGTHRVRDLVPGAGGSDPQDLFDFHGTLYFSAKNAAGARTTWRSDGTEAGTFALDGTTINPGVFDDEGRLYFVAYTPGVGYEIHRSDATAAGTQLFVDVNVGQEVWPPYNLLWIGGALYFIADDGQQGDALWRSDGTTEGTVRLHAIDPKAYRALPKRFAALGETFVGAGFDGHGYELWTLRREGALPAGGDFDANGQIDGNDFLLWQRELGTTQLDADANRNGIVDGADLAYWRNGFGLPPEMTHAMASTAAVLPRELDAALADLAAANAAIGESARARKLRFLAPSGRGSGERSGGNGR
jgi:ELWxxDGT repeat protein